VKIIIMKAILTFFKNWFERNGLIKMLAAFALLMLAVVIGRKFPGTETICGWVAVISGCYLVLTILIFTIAGIINGIRDRKRMRNEKSNTEK
jgi:predicted tellurium resistance membrane protein TerC